MHRIHSTIFPVLSHIMRVAGIERGILLDFVYAIRYPRFSFATIAMNGRLQTLLPQHYLVGTRYLEIFTLLVVGCPRIVLAPQ